MEDKDKEKKKNTIAPLSRRGEPCKLKEVDWIEKHRNLSNAKLAELLGRSVASIKRIKHMWGIKQPARLKKRMPNLTKSEWIERNKHTLKHKRNEEI